VTHDQKQKDLIQKRKLTAYIRAFVVPTILIKVFMLYFGLNYAAYPERGYVYGLAATVILSLANFSYFLYLNWNEADD
jgi:hypothetical protein